MTTPISSPTSSTFASTIATTVWNRAEFKPSQSGNNQEEKLRPSAVVILHPQRQALPLEYTLFLEPHTWSSWTERWRNQLGLSPGDKVCPFHHHSTIPLFYHHHHEFYLHYRVTFVSRKVQRSIKTLTSEPIHSMK